MTTPRPTLRQQRLARVLEQLRVAAGLSKEAVAAQLSVSPSTVWRWERPDKTALPSRLKLARLVELYQVDEEQRPRIIDLARDADGHGWWQPYEGELSPTLLSLIELEGSEASSAQTFDLIRVPGLLQTPAYTRALIRGELPMTEDEIEQRVKVRAERQAVLDRVQPLRLWAILDEAALHRMVGGPVVMAEQMRHLIAVAAAPHVTVQVVPYQAGAHPGDGSFVILDLPEAEVPGVVYVDGMAGQLFMEDAADLARFREVFDRLRATALSPDASGHLIATLMRDIEGEAG